ncbi:uncharacterized protein LOC117178638 [Belonocnema kinseyi]|uniref:uncharacterized protein LOC117178638 n=1 Tax=Belonocnema kinseyi TaxID=2817044 RepID=UPI00143D3AAF|nr:uncharacterized protein LOC117178638 [Belonocnema kinseyi]
MGISPGHRPQQCASKYTCAKCNRKHNTLLQFNNWNSANDSVAPTQESNLMSPNVNNSQITSISQNNQNTPVNNDQSTVIREGHHVLQNNKSICLLNNHDGIPGTTLLVTAVLELKADNGKCESFRLLMDQGSECSFISGRVLIILKPICHKITGVYGVGGEFFGNAKRVFQVWLRPKESKRTPIPLQELVFFNSTSYAPPKLLDQANLRELRNFSLADPDFFEYNRIDVILEADRSVSCLLPRLKQGILGSLTAQDSLFGLILSRPIQQSEIGRSISACHCTASELHDNLSRFWEMEEPLSSSSLTEDEIHCEEHFVANCTRLPSGQYMIRLPFRNGPPIEIGNSLCRAKIILEKNLAQLKNEPELQSEYSAFMSEHRQLSHMELVKDFTESDSSQTVYLPHHTIIRDSSSTTHLRVVSNASSLTSNGSSLNSHLHICPKLLTDLISIILRWRMSQFVFVADVEKMFRQIKVDPRDCDYQRVLWSSPEGNLEAWRLTTVTYGELVPRT